MQLQLLSDLHFEFHRDAGKSFVESMDPDGVDVLVLAGDIAVGHGIEPALAAFAQRYPSSEIIYVHGNHEFYGSDRARVLAQTRRAVERHQNLHWLDCEAVDLGGRRFLGAPLWFRGGAEAERLKRCLSDYSEIQGFEAWVYEENARAVGFLEREVQPGDVVITHHLPCAASVAPAYVGSPLNAFFVSDVEPLIRAQRPALWLHGHTHASVDCTVGETRIVCNPFGYVPDELNAQFQDRLLIAL